MDIVNGLFSVLPQNIHIRGQYLKVDILCKPQKDVLFALGIKILLVKALKQLLSVLHKLFMCFVKLTLWSMVILRCFTSLLLFIFSTINVKLLLFTDDLRNII